MCVCCEWWLWCSCDVCVVCLIIRLLFSTSRLLLHGIRMCADAAGADASRCVPAAVVAVVGVVIVVVVAVVVVVGVVVFVVGLWYCCW